MINRKLAIVIPYFKNEYFRECLESLEKQNDNRFNVYIGDDSSPQDPWILINSSQKKLNITYKRFDKNLGSISLTQQWERCLGMINGEEWIMLLCDDDVLSENVVNSFYKNLDEIEDAKSKVVKFASQVVDEYGKPVTEKYCHPKLQDYRDVFYDRFFNANRSSLSEHIFRRTSFQKYGFHDYPLAWHADDMAWLEFSEFGKIYSINEACVYFRSSAIHLSRSDFLLEEKRDTTYLFFNNVIYEYLENFNQYQITAILKRYELLTFSFKKVNFNFVFQFFRLKLKHEGIYEALKFIRRICINRKELK
ncbi:hypothetical protein SAMN04488033_10781 [Salegentibacter agarivorans]|uniref:Glycosyltransferase 2-like domain-containing protein n=1 Tax=Salegentibacter agarivorans TaxID=345907 RepID=A0A1I2L623_9FLAO|nr:MULTISPECIES: glycosyltransferase [Salegentibacter]SFF74373.1 hypothetical protein SAMN04488033_10781 [Salegentibacter agarivorans]